MKNFTKALILIAAVSIMGAPAMADCLADGAALFKKKCKICHAVDKKKTGPSLKSMSQNEARLRNVITNGGKNKMMKAYGKKFSTDQVDALVAYIRSRQ